MLQFLVPLKYNFGEPCSYFLYLTCGKSAVELAGGYKVAKEVVIEEGRLVETPVNGKMTIERLVAEDSIILKNGS